MNSLRRLIGVGIGSMVSASMLFASVALGASTAAAEDNTGAVYVLTNESTNNQVAIFNRDAKGGLTAAGTVATHGSGNGGSLGSQGAIGLSDDNQWLFAVNAGSNQVTTFDVKKNGLDFASIAASGGVNPTSVTVSKDVLYVLNAGDSTHAANINGYKIGRHGKLTWLAGSTQPLSSAGPGSTVGAAEVKFNPDGDLLVVTEKATKTIDVYQVDKRGVAQAPTSFPSYGTTPYGFDFNKKGYLIVSEAATRALSSYAVSDHSLQVISGSVATQQIAPCWTITTKNGKYAYTANAGSDSISGFSIARDGSLTALTPNGVTGTMVDKPLDMGISADSHFLYALVKDTPGIGAFRINADGSLTALAGISGLPAAASIWGLTAR